MSADDKRFYPQRVKEDAASSSEQRTWKNEVCHDFNRWVRSTCLRRGVTRAELLTALGAEQDPDALRTGAGAGGWRTIESAPKDGTRVLLFSPYGARGRVHTGSAQGPGTQWWEAGHSVHPTHWMPLPPAPPTEETP